MGRCFIDWASAVVGEGDTCHLSVSFINHSSGPITESDGRYLTTRNAAIAGEVSIHPISKIDIAGGYKNDERYVYDAVSSGFAFRCAIQITNKCC